MPTIPKKLYIGQPTTSNTTLYTVPGGQKTIVKSLILTNTKVTEAAVDVYFVPSGGAANLTNRIISQYAIAGLDTVVIDLSAVMETGDAIVSSQYTDGSISLYISGVEVS